MADLEHGPQPVQPEAANGDLAQRIRDAAANAPALPDGQHEAIELTQQVEGAHSDAPDYVRDHSLASVADEHLEQGAPNSLADLDTTPEPFSKSEPKDAATEQSAAIPPTINRRGLLGKVAEHPRASGLVASALALGGVVAGIAMSSSGNSEKAAKNGPAVVESTNNSPSAEQSNQQGSNNTASSLPGNNTSSVPVSRNTVDSQEFSAGKLDPKIPVAVPYVEGQKVTPADIEKLFHNIDVAVTTGDLENLRYSGINPNTDFASKLQTHEMAAFNTEKNSDSGDVNYFQTKFFDNDVWIDPADPLHGKVISASGTDFDFRLAPDRVYYNLIEFHLGHAVETLDGQPQEILTFVGYVNVSDSTNSDWNDGFSG